MEVTVGDVIQIRNTRWRVAAIVEDTRERRITLWPLLPNGEVDEAQAYARECALVVPIEPLARVVSVDQPAAGPIHVHTES